jgi:hypothetical protein
MEYDAIYIMHFYLYLLLSDDVVARILFLTTLNTTPFWLSH